MFLVIEEYSEFSQTSKVEFFVRKVKRFTGCSNIIHFAEINIKVPGDWQADCPIFQFSKMKYLNEKKLMKVLF